MLAPSPGSWAPAPRLQVEALELGDVSVIERQVHLDGDVVLVVGAAGRDGLGAPPRSTAPRC
jgi:hypothetical protein